MTKFAFLDEHGYEVIFEKKEEDNIESKIMITEAHYFEVNLVRGKELCIKLESDEGEIVYHNPSEIMVNGNEGHIKVVKPLNEGDVMGCLCSFFNGEDGNVYSSIQLLHNGESNGVAMRMKGKTVTPMIYHNPETTTVRTSQDFGKSKAKEGKFLNIHKQQHTWIIGFRVG